MDSNLVLEVSEVSKNYGRTAAVNNISFTVRSGEILGLLGPNGAGKTTTINMILAVLKADHGLIKVSGKNIAEKRSEAMTETGFAAVYTQLPGNMSVYQNLRIFGLIYGVADLKKRIEESLKEFELEKFRDTKCGLLSSGEQTRVSLAKAMLNNPRLLLLDEPTASLDPATARIIRQKIKDYAKNDCGGVLWTSHNMHEVADVCDRVLFLSQGKIVLEGDPKKLPREHNKENLEELFISVANEPLASE